MISKLLTAAAIGAFAIALNTAPIGIDPASGSIVAKSAFAKHGGDDGAGDDRGGGGGGGGGGEPQPGDDRGGR